MNKQTAGRVFVLSLLFTILTVTWRTAVAGDLLLIDKLIREQNYQQAYLQASQLLDDYAGESNFDFLYAIAAIESGHPHHAIFPLERLVHQFPDNGRIKVELARAHFLTGDDKTATQIFSAVLKTNPPDNVKQNIAGFLKVIEQRRLARQNKLSASLKISAGWDSNYNSAPDLSIVQIGGINFTLNENSCQQDTYYSGVDANLAYHQTINKKFAMNYGVYIQNRENIGNDLDTQALGLYVAPMYATRSGNYRFPVQIQQLNLDGESYRQYGSAGMEWTPSIKQNSQWTHFMQYGLIRYPDQPARDMSLVVLGTSYQVISKKGNVYQTALFYNDESSELDVGEYNEIDSLGLRNYMKWSMSSENSLFSRITLQTMKYGETHPVFNELRKDNFYSVALGWELKLNPVTVITTEAEYSENSSNIELYDYDRTSAFISLRYSFL